MLKNRTAVVTGAGITSSGGGLGAAYALDLAKNGANVVLTDLNVDLLEPTFERFRQEQLPYRHIELDLTKSDNAELLMSFASNAYGSVDILVNNAGVLPNSDRDHVRKINMYTRRHSGDVSTELSVNEIEDVEWLRFWDMNVHGTFWCLRAACRHMAPRKYGRIINVASISAFSDIGSFSPGYAASKAAVHNLTLSVAEECARHGILVNTIAPSAVESKAWLSNPKDLIEGATKKVPIGRIASYKDYASVVTMLAGEHYFVGQLLSPNGGIVF